MSRAGQFVVTLDLGGTKLSGALIDRSGKIVRRMSVGVDGRSTMAPVRQMVEMVKAVASDEWRVARKDESGESNIGLRSKDGRPPRQKKDRLKIAGVGVAVPGLVRRDGTVWAPNLKGWTRMPLARRLREELRVPVKVESDRNAAVLGESWLGAARGKKDVIVLMIGTGIGAGILSGGRLVRGAHELSGCAGWMTVRDEHAGEAERVGQLEWLGAGPGIAKAAEKELARGVASLLSEIPAGALTALEVAEAARRGDMVSIEVFLEAGRWLGYGAANLVSLFDPEMVVIGGGLAKASDLYLDVLRKAMKERAQPIAAAKVKVVVSRLGGDANLLGAAKVAWESTWRLERSSGTSAQQGRKRGVEGSAGVTYVTTGRALRHGHPCPRTGKGVAQSKRLLAGLGPVVDPLVPQGRHGVHNDGGASGEERAGECGALRSDRGAGETRSGARGECRGDVEGRGSGERTRDRRKLIRR